jgi:hypothetical protein
MKPPFPTPISGKLSFLRQDKNEQGAPLSRPGFNASESRDPAKAERKETPSHLP